MKGMKHEKEVYRYRSGKGVSIWKNGLKYDGEWGKGCPEKEDDEEILKKEGVKHGKGV